MRFKLNYENELAEYFNGKKLIGDNYSKEDILAWYSQEKEAYASLFSSEPYFYKYHALNKACGFDFIKVYLMNNLRVCAFGSAYGDELIPISDMVISTILIDSDDSFHKKSVFEGVKKILANPGGEIKLPDQSLDLITCFGVLHHIPNVSFVLSELARCLTEGGILLIREPITTMGDWRFLRTGATKNERGIPDKIFDQIIQDCGLQIIKKTPCFFPPFSAVCRKLGIHPYMHKVTVSIDLLLSKIFIWNYRYHRTNFVSKFAPACNFYVCQKR